MLYTTLYGVSLPWRMLPQQHLGMLQTCLLLYLVALKQSQEVAYSSSYLDSPTRNGLPVPTPPKI